jgi:ABC transport system ATP-binding/permease protein
MTLLSVNALSCTQSFKLLFENASFGVEAQDKVALIGRNGSGKTSLLTILAESQSVSNPAIALQQGLRITTLAQQSDFDPEHTILDHLFRSQTRAAKAIHSYQSALLAFETGESTTAEEDFNEANSEMEQANAWEYEARVSSLLRELNIELLTQKMKDLSGGMRKKIALAQAFFEDSDLLILDEPTNHLDVVTIEWLETMLKRYPSAVLMVTHDRYFLDKICTKILEIDQQKVFSYKGNYQTYLEQREQRYLTQDKHEQSIQSVLRVELAWLRRGPKARSTKQKARQDRAYDMINRDALSKDVDIELAVSHRRLGKKILELKEVSKSFTDKHLITNFSHSFKVGERIGILGPNGTGKTTLLKLLMQQLEPDKGVIDVGVNTVFGYFDQHSQVLDDTQTIYEYVSSIGSQITRPDGSIISASKLLETFLFPSQMLKTPINKLSGGERRRLHLVCLLLKNPNFLLFDEPTNDLDIQTLSVLEDFLMNFSGCIIVISHDRYFMDRVVDHLFIFNPGGQINEFTGSYSEYRDYLKEMKAEINKKSTPSQGKQHNRKEDKTVKALSFNEQQEFKTLEKDIEALEAEKKDLSAQFSSGTLHADHYKSAGARLKAIDEQLETKFLRWEGLGERT